VVKQDFPRTDYEVIVVVDGSADGTVEMLKDLKAPCAFQYIEQANQGQDVARNAGAKAARGRWILFLDDDLFCAPALLREHARAHSQAGGELLLAIGPILASSDSMQTLATEWVKEHLEAYYS